MYKRKGHSEIENINGIEVIRLSSENIYWGADRKEHGVNTKIRWHLNTLFSRKFISKVEEVIDDIEPEVILIQNLSEFGTKIYKVSKKYRMIQVLRDYNLIEPTKNIFFNTIFSRINKMRSKKIHEVVSVSKFTESIYKNAQYFLNAKFSVIGNVVKAECLTTKEVKLKNKKLKVGFFGQAMAHKGINEFIDAINLCSFEIDYAIIVGRGSEDLKHENTNSKLRFLGSKKLEDVYKLMADIDLIIMPSKFEEPFGRVIIEGYRQRTIVISSNNGALSELNIDKDLILDEVSSVEIANKIKRVYSKKYSLKKYEIYSENFINNSEQYIRLIENQE